MSRVSATALAIDDASLFQSSISLIAPTSDGDADDDDNGKVERPLIEENVLMARLTELRMWQQSQQRLLINDQVSERERLHREKVKLYELFGLSMTSEPEETDETIDHEDEECDDAEEVAAMNNKNLSMDEKQIIRSPPIKLHLNKIVQNMAIRPKANVDASAAAVAPMTCETIVKRPYLKRGEGLTNRFKIAPDAFRLDNLPKYKFARRRSMAHVHQHPNHNRHQQRQTNESKAPAASAPAITTTQRHQTTTPAGEGQQNNVKRNQIFHVNQSGALKLKAKPSKNCVTHEDVHQHQQQHRLTDENTSKGIKS